MPTPGWGGVDPSVPGTADAPAGRSFFGPGDSRGDDAARGGDATEDWTIVSGGGDGAVAHWTVVGLASAREVAGGVEEAGVELHKIGGYEVWFCLVAGWFEWLLVA